MDDNERRTLARSLEKEVAGTYGLKDWYTWKKWLLSDKERYGNTDYDDNWLFCEIEYQEPEILARVQAGDEIWYVTKQYRKHKISGKEFCAFEVYSDLKFLCCEAVCGFDYEEG